MLSLIIPCYNEGENLKLLIPRCAEVVTESSGQIEVVLVDNGSSDNSPELLKDLPKGVRSTRVDVNQGYGFGILHGLAEGTGEHLGWCHADMQTDPMDAWVGYQMLLQSSDPDNTYIKGKRYGRPIMDDVFTVGMSFFETVLMQKRLWDINAQPNIFPRGFYEKLENPPHDFSLDLFFYYQAKRLGLEVKRFDVKFGERAHGVSHWNVDMSAKVKFIKRTLDYSFKLRRSL